MKRLSLSTLTLLFVLFFSTSLHAQQSNGVIKGQVLDSDQKPIPHISVVIEGTSRGASTNVQGRFSITNVPSGRHSILVSGIGYEGRRKQVELERGETKMVDFQLAPKYSELQELVVEGAKVNKFSNKTTPYVSKIPLRDIDNPQVYHTVNSELMAEQVTTSFEDALSNAPGVFKLWESTGRGGDGSGYYSVRGFPVQPQIVNGLTALADGTLDPVNMDRIEIIKGPSGTLYGSSHISYGGLINVVTKKPYDSFGGEFSYKTGSFGLNRFTADVNTPIGDEEDIALRVTSAYHQKDSFQDAGFHESFFIGPSLSYQANEDLSFLVSAEFYQSEHTNPTMLFLNRSEPLEYENLTELNYNPERSYTSNDLTLQNPTAKVQARMKYHISDNWTSETALSRSRSKSKGYYSYLWDFAAYNGNFGRFVNNQNSIGVGTNIQQNFIGEFDLGPTSHKMVVGLDYHHHTTINNSTGYVLYDNITLGGADTSAISKPAVDEALADARVNKSSTSEATYSAYASDVIDFNRYISSMVSLRLDHFVNHGTDNARTNQVTGEFEQTTLSPKFGVVVKPLPDQVSIFANYMNGFSNVSPRTQGDGTTRSFEPERANQWEMGVKLSTLNGKVDATLTYYDITVTNVVRPDPERTQFYVQDGENYSRGFEASVTASPLPGLNVRAGYSHNESEILRTGNEALVGRRPESAGPSDMAHGWVSYQVNRGMLTGLGIGVGGHYASENLIMNRRNTGTFALPSYTTLESTIFYNTQEFRMALKLNNITDEQYYKGWTTVNPQAPRAVKASLTYRF